jgi:hypothetical protein
MGNVIPLERFMVIQRHLAECNGVNSFTILDKKDNTELLRQ